MKAYLTIFLITFLAEMGDKTQLSTLLFAADKETNRWGVLVAATCALTVTTFLAVIVGCELDKYLSANSIKRISGVGFIAIGIWTLASCRV